jgi:hypothetical protein
MGKRSFWALAIIFIFCLAPKAQAVMFSDLIDFDVPGLGPDNTGSIGVFDNAPPLWAHDITDDIAGYSIIEIDITQASLSVSYRGTGGNESWSISADGIDVGALTASETSIVTSTFPLNADAVFLLKQDGLLNIIPLESTSGRDGFRLYEATLSGEYEPLQKQLPIIPEPQSALLLTGGLLFLIGNLNSRGKFS